MQEILGQAKTIRPLLADTKYSIDYYQREYKWEEKQITELVDDLTSRFLQDYEPGHRREDVEKYGPYFLGSIIISRKDSQNFIVDGQQRLTSLTLLLIYLNNLQRSHPQQVPIVNLIFSEKFGNKTFNLNVEERISCMEALFDDKAFDETGKSESVQNIVQRYNDIKAAFPEELLGEALPYFIDWLTEKVYLVEITAYSDDDAYTIFETMNDRGLSLRLTDMLKGYLLANITDEAKRNSMHRLWKQRLSELEEYGKEIDADFFKAWLRSQYAESIREHKKGAKPEEFDRIGTEFHRWIRDHNEKLGLTSSNAFAPFIEHDFDFYVRQYRRLMQAAKTLTPGLEHIYYNARLGFTTQYQLLLAPLTPGDPENVVNQKFRLVGLYLDILLNRRIWNWHNIGFSTMQYAMFLVMREIRGSTPEKLAEQLYQRLEREKQTFTSNPRFSLNQRNGIFVHLLLARITGYVEQQSNTPSRYVEYIKRENKYEVEHIWANKPERHADEFAQQADFLEYRNRIGGLLLLPKSFNASYGALPSEEKLPLYHGHNQNLLACSLYPSCYEHNPGFLSFVKRSKLLFKPYSTFRKSELDERQELYCQIAERVWNPEHLLAEVAK